nr:receptor-like protein 38 [Lolium perenne]
MPAEIVQAQYWNMNLTIFSSFPELQLLDFSANFACLQNFDGLQGLSKLKHLNLRNNYFIGSILGSVSKLVSLEVINLSRNNMSGSLQNTGLGNLRKLRKLRLGSRPDLWSRCAPRTRILTVQCAHGLWSIAEGCQLNQTS